MPNNFILMPNFIHNKPPFLLEILFYLHNSYKTSSRIIGFTIGLIITILLDRWSGTDYFCKHGVLAPSLSSIADAG